jgi:hypothetical protein
MNTPTFKEQFDKITMAYFDDTLEPYTNCACFIGNLLGGEKWAWCRGDWGVVDKSINSDYVDEGIKFILRSSNGLYTPLQIFQMEKNFLTIISKNTSGSDDLDDSIDENLEHEDYEHALFLAMDSTLDMLRKIHEAKGEVIESFEFKKRELQPV